MLKYKDIGKLAKTYKRRCNSTKHETMFRCFLGKHLNNRFNHQKQIGNCIVDFWFARRLLIVEIDGSSHLTTKNKDATRDKFFSLFGLNTLRFTNHDVETRPDRCLDQILLYPELDINVSYSKPILRGIKYMSIGSSDFATQHRAIKWEHQRINRQFGIKASR